MGPESQFTIRMDRFILMSLISVFLEKDLCSESSRTPSLCYSKSTDPELREQGSALLDVLRGPAEQGIQRGAIAGQDDGRLIRDFGGRL